MSTVSSAVVALAFIGQIAHLAQAFLLFALALLPALVLLGSLTYLRLVQTAIEDVFDARAINPHPPPLPGPGPGRGPLVCAVRPRRPG